MWLYCHLPPYRLIIKTRNTPWPLYVPFTFNEGVQDAETPRPMFMFPPITYYQEQPWLWCLFYFHSAGVPDKTPLSTFMFIPYHAMRQRCQEHFISILLIGCALYSTPSHTCSSISNCPHVGHAQCTKAPFTPLHLLHMTPQTPTSCS